MHRRISVCRFRQGFTLIELMIVVAVIGILAAIAIPQMARMADKSKEASTKGNLGTLRSALAIYYGDNESVFPVDNLSSLLANQKYLAVVPAAQLPRTPENAGHADSASIQAGGLAALTDNGGWLYNNLGGADPGWGSIVVNCSHEDMSQGAWTSF